MYLNAGYGGFFSSIAWVGAIFEFSTVLFDGEAPDHLDSYLGSACDLDTNWAYSRLVASWILLDTKGLPHTAALPYLEDGAKRFPEMWKFRITWAQAVLDYTEDSILARDSAANILLPLSTIHSVPEYARNLGFTLLHKSGKPEQAMQILVQTLEQIPDPLVRHQYHRKIGDLLWRNQISLGEDSTSFMNGIEGMLSSDPVQAGAAKALLIRMVQPETKDEAVLEARHLARQFRDYQSAQLGATR